MASRARTISPAQTSYRNPVLAEALKTLGAVNRFGRGVERARAALAKNGNRAPEFFFGDTYFGVTIFLASPPEADRQSRIWN